MAQARSDYNNFCIRCHKEDGTGGKFELDEGGSINVPSLRKHGLKDSDAELAHHIADGGKQMPAFKDRLSEERINGLVKFIRAEYHGRAPGNAATTTGASTTTSPTR
jgi:mono/diheme cytochrome c family protein